MERKIIDFVANYRDNVLWDIGNSICTDETRQFMKGEEFALRKVEAKIRELLKPSNKPTQEQLNDFWENK